MKTSTKVFCKCKSEFQDKQYGTGARVATVSSKAYKKENQRSEARCTVCGAVHKDVRV